MKIYNKFVESKKEPYNKSDIWFDGSSWKMYKEGMWRAFTLPLDAAERVAKMLEEFKLFKIVSSLPQVGEGNIIYLVENVDSVEGNSLIEYIYINNKWEEVGKFTPEINLDDYAKKTDIVHADYIENNTSNKSYIINKPCSIDYITISDNPVISDMSVSGFENSETYEVSIQYYTYMNIIGLCFEYNDYNGMVYVPIKYGEINTFYQTIYYGGISYRITIKIDAAYGPGGARQIKVKSDSKITKIIGVAGFNKINENFIPSTIARKTDINNKVDKVEGKGLSTNDYTNEDKSKLAELNNYDDTEIRNEISLRNVRAVAIDEEVEEPEDKYATKGYVDEAINSAITNTLNTEV